MASCISNKRRKAIFSLGAGQVLIAGHLASATSYSWANPALSGTWQTATNWTPNGVPSSASDTGNISDATANRTVTYITAASSAVGTLSMTQSNNFLDELDLQQSGSSTLTISNPIVLSAAGSGTSELFLDPAATTGTRTGTLAAPSIAINAGGVLELSSFDSVGTVNLSQVSSNITISGGTLFSDQGIGTATTNSDANTINGSLTMTSGTFSLGQHAPGVGSNAKLTSGVATINDRINIVGNLNISGGTLTAGAATNVLFLEGASNSIALTGNGPLLPVINLQGLASGTQTFLSNSAITTNFSPRQLLTTANLVSVVQIGALSSTGTLSIGSITFQAKGIGQTQTLQLVSNLATPVSPNYSGNPASVTDVIDTNGFTFDATGTIFTLIGGTTAVDNIINSAGAGSVGTVKAAAFDLSKPTSGENIGSYVNLVALGTGVSTLSASASSSGTTIDPNSTFTYSGTASGTGSVQSTRNIGNLVVTAQTLNLGSNITNATTSAVNVTGGTLSLNGFTLTTPSATVAGTLSGTGTLGTTTSAGTTISGSVAPGGVGNVGTITLATGSGAFTLTSAETAKFDVVSSASFDQINLNAATIAYGGVLALNFTSSPSTMTTYQLFSNLGAESGNFSSLSTNLSASDSASFDPTTGVLTVSVVPEPVSMAVVSVLPALLMRRRRQSKFFAL